MLHGFRMGGDWWTVRIVPPSSPFLIDRTNHRTVATTDARTHRINVSSALTEPMLTRVLIHEACHAVMESFGIAESIRAIVPRNRIVEVEETVCNLIADHGFSIMTAGRNAAKTITDSKAEKKRAV